MMPKYSVQYDGMVVARPPLVFAVEASCEEEAIQKAVKEDILSEDEDEFDLEVQYRLYPQSDEAEDWEVVGVLPPDS